MMPNQPTPGNAGWASRFHSERHLPRVPESDRSRNAIEWSRYRQLFPCDSRSAVSLSATSWFRPTASRLPSDNYFSAPPKNNCRWPRDGKGSGP